MRFYPPLLFQRIKVQGFEKGYKGVSVKISKSFLNRNYNNSIFGGTIFSAADPFYPVLFYQVLTRRGYQIKAWSKSSAIRYRKPCKTDMHFSINLKDEDFAACEQQLNTTGKFRMAYPIDIYDQDSKLCVSLLSEVYVRNINYVALKTPVN